MYYIDNELLKKLPEESRLMIEKEGTPIEDKEEVNEGEKAADKLNEINPIDKEEVPGMEKEDIVSDEFKMPKPQKYGEEGEFEDIIEKEGKIKELPNSKKNKIESFQDANIRGNALIEMLEDKELKKKKKKLEVV